MHSVTFCDFLSWKWSWGNSKEFMHFKIMNFDHLMHVGVSVSFSTSTWICKTPVHSAQFYWDMQRCNLLLSSHNSPNYSFLEFGNPGIWTKRLSSSTHVVTVEFKSIETEIFFSKKKVLNSCDRCHLSQVGCN